MKRESGASSTEYILLIVMIALAAICMVKGFGVELRTLFSRSTNALNLFENNASEEGTGDLNEPEPGPSPPPQEPDHETECQQQWAALRQEMDTVGASLAQARMEAQRHYQLAMHRERYWVGGHHSRWGGGSSGHWAYRYVHSDSERAAARDQFHRAQTAYDDWNRDWQQRFHQWQANCGH